jgi:hypothetical protein
MLALSLFFVSAWRSVARAETSFKLQVPVAIGAGVPLGELSERTGPVGFALMIGGLVSYDRVPLWIGGDLGGVLLLSDTTTRPSRDFPQLDVRTTSKPRALLAHFTARLQSPFGSVQPYLEGRIGLKHFGTETNVSIRGNSGSAVVDESFTPRATALSMGISIGLDMVVQDARRDDSSKEAPTSKGAWGVSVHYLRGRPATFAEVDLADPVLAQSRETVLFRANTDLLLVMLGASFYVL